MNILQITHRLPWPLIDGGKIGIYNFTRHYHSAGHMVHLICIVPKNERDVDISELKKVCRSLHVCYKDTRNKKTRLFANLLFSRLPYTIKKYIYKDVASLILETIANNSIDVVHVDHLHMAHYVQLIRIKHPSLPLAIREHNVEYMILQRYYQTQNNPIIRFLLRNQYLRLRQYEQKALNWFDAIFAITKNDYTRILELNPCLEAKVHVIPAGVDLASMPIIPYDNGHDIIHMAAMDWLPNQEGLIWFIKEVFPLILEQVPDTKLHIVGKNTPDSFYHSQSDAITVHGFVDDPSTIMRSCRLAVVPLMAGGGMRVKILNYMSCGIPVVSTNVGSEGIDAINREHILNADEPQEFTDCVVRILTDDTLRQSLSQKGRSLVEKAYTWPSIVAQTLSIFEGLLSKKYK